MWSPLRRTAALVAAFVPLALMLGCVKPPANRAETPPAPVMAAIVGKKTMPVQIRAIGKVKSVSTYAVRPRVNGELTEVYFKEGDDVKKGQKLFTIDPRPYEGMVKLKQAGLAKKKAVLEGADRDLERAERASRNGVASREDLDAARTAVASAKASVAEDEAALNSAQLQLSFTTIFSPHDGRTGEIIVTNGNLVSPTDKEPLAVVNQVSPIDVVFSLPEHLLQEVEAARRRGPLPVTAHPRNSDPVVSGTLSFSDNAVDTGSGTIQLKAEFPNTRRKLWPGQFVDVVLTTGERPESVVVPTSAIQSGQKGQYVFLVGAGQKAVLRQVTVAFEESGEAVIASGLKGGEMVVTDGQLRLAPGIKMDVKNMTPDGKPRAPEVAGANGERGQGVAQ